MLSRASGGSSGRCLLVFGDGEGSGGFRFFGGLCRIFGIVGAFRVCWALRVVALFFGGAWGVFRFAERAPGIGKPHPTWLFWDPGLFSDVLEPHTQNIQGFKKLGLEVVRVKLHPRPATPSSLTSHRFF